MNEFMFLLLCILAVYRLSTLLSWDVITEPLREVFLRKSPTGKVWSYLCDWIYCPYCNGIWFSAIAAVWFSANLVEYVVCWLGIAGAQAILVSISKRD